MNSRNARRRARLPRWLQPQFALRTLLLFTMAVCLVLGWHVERVRRQRRAIAALVKAGAHTGYRDVRDDPFEPDFPDEFENPQTLAEWVEWSTPRRLRVALGIDFFRNVDCVYFDEGDDFPAVVEYLRDLPAVRRLQLSGVLDEDLGPIATLKQLTDLDPGASPITDAGLTEIAKLCNLTHLDLSYSEITDAGMAQLANLRRLKHLKLCGKSVGDAGVSYLSEMSELEFLDLTLTKVTDKGLAHLTRLKRLKHVGVSHTAVGDRAVAILAEMPELESLGAAKTRITDDGLPPLRRLKNLKKLNLSETAITDRGIRVIGDLASLEDIHVDNSPVTVEGAAWLEQKLPKASIHCYFTQVQEEVEISRAQLLVEAGLWQEGLKELRRLDASYLQSIEGSHDLGRCYAEGEQWAQAAKYYQRALDLIPQATTSHYWTEEQIWSELYRWPPLFQRIADARPNDYWRWAICARCAFLEGRWSEAVEDYARAVKCPHRLAPPDGDERVEFEYGLSRLLIGDAVGHRQACERLFEADRRAKKMYDGAFRDNWLLGTHLWFVAPQGNVTRSQIADWKKDDKASSWQYGELPPLIFCRAAMFDEALNWDRPQLARHDGRYWFSQAMACWHLGQKPQACECYQRGVRWLERRMKADRLEGYWHGAGRLLEAEVLRREAERLIFKTGITEQPVE